MFPCHWNILQWGEMIKKKNIFSSKGTDNATFFFIFFRILKWLFQGIKILKQEGKFALNGSYFPPCIYLLICEIFYFIFLNSLASLVFKNIQCISTCLSSSFTKNLVSKYTLLYAVFKIENENNSFLALGCLNSGVKKTGFLYPCCFH